MGFRHISGDSVRCILDAAKIEYCFGQVTSVIYDLSMGLTSAPTERTYFYNVHKTEYVTLGQMEGCQPPAGSTRCGHLTGRLANRLSGTRVYKSYGGAGLGVCVLRVFGKVRAFSAATQPGLTLGSSSCLTKEQPPHAS